MMDLSCVGRWYFTPGALKTLSEGRLDIEALQAQIDADPAFVELFTDQLAGIDSVLGSGFEITPEGIRAHGLAGTYLAPYEALQVEGAQLLRFSDGDGDPVQLRWDGTSLTYLDDLALSRTRLALSLPGPADDASRGADQGAVRLLVDTFFHGRAQQLLTMVASAWAEPVARALGENLDADQQRELAAGLQELCTKTVAAESVRYEDRVATHLLGRLEPAARDALVSVSQSSALETLRATLVAEQVALERLQVTAVTGLAQALGKKVYSLVERILASA